MSDAGAEFAKEKDNPALKFVESVLEKAPPGRGKEWLIEAADFAFSKLELYNSEIQVLSVKPEMRLPEVFRDTNFPFDPNLLILPITDPESRLFLWRVVYYSLKKVFEGFSPKLLESDDRKLLGRYFESMSNLFSSVPCPFLGISNGYAFFGKRISDEEAYLSRILRSSESEKEAFERNNRIYKVHLQVPYSETVKVLKTFLDHWNERIARVCPQFKVLVDFNPQDSDGTVYPNFVFYPFPYEEGQTPEESLVELVILLKDILEPLGLGSLDLPGTPRYSFPVIITEVDRKSGRVVKKDLPGVYYTIGNGDYKDELRNKGLLDEFYPPETNHALPRGHKGVNFEIQIG